MKKLFLSVCFLVTTCLANEHIDLPTSGNLFVSLGSTCEIAWFLRRHDQRSCALPFDWLYVANHQGLIDIINDDFEFLIDKEHLVESGRAGRVWNTKYQIEFRHDWTKQGYNFERQYDNVLQKYKRRIERFRKIKDYPDKVYFCRCPIKNLRWALGLSKESLQISGEQANTLYDTLRKRFPSLDFSLIIVNYDENKRDVQFDPDGKFIRCLVRRAPKQKEEDYNYIFNRVLEHDK